MKRAQPTALRISAAWARVDSATLARLSRLGRIARLGATDSLNHSTTARAAKPRASGAMVPYPSGTATPSGTSGQDRRVTFNSMLVDVGECGEVSLANEHKQAGKGGMQADGGVTTVTVDCA